MSELIIIAVGLAMDAFAVAICKGLNMRKLDYKQKALFSHTVNSDFFWYELGDIVSIGDNHAL